jgi:arabinose-5-phosphate isomerase
MVDVILAAARRTIETEAKAVSAQLAHLDNNFVAAVRLISECQSRLVVMGIGKSGLIGRKIAATMSSVGIPAVFQHPAECLHGDLGMLIPGDVVLMLSYTGESDEIIKVLSSINSFGIRVIAMTGKPRAGAWKDAECIVNSSIAREACPFNIAPTSSTTAMLALGDALALCASQKKGFKIEQLASFHPGGGIGKRITTKVADVMRSGRENPKVQENATLSKALVVMTKTRRGAAIAVNKSGVLTGFFTDGDLRRKLQKDPQLLSKRLKDVMTINPKTVGPGILASEAAKLLKKLRVDNMPVVDAKNRPIGIIDEQDLLAEGIV